MRDATVSNGRLAMAGERGGGLSFIPPSGEGVFFYEETRWEGSHLLFGHPPQLVSSRKPALGLFILRPVVSAVAGNHMASKESRRQVSRTQNRLRKGAGPRQKASGKKGIHAPLFFVNKGLPPAPATKRNSLRRPETIPEWMNSPISFSCLKIGASPVW